MNSKCLAKCGVKSVTTLIQKLTNQNYIDQKSMIKNKKPTYIKS